MSFGTYLRFNQTADIYQKITTVSPAGQKTFEYSLLRTIPVFLQSHGSETSNTGKRIVPYQDYISMHQMIVAGEDADVIDFVNRVNNIKDRYGEVLESGPFEIVSIQPKFGFNGKKQHILAVIRKVVEQS